MSSNRQRTADSKPFVVAAKLLVPRLRPETVVRERLIGLLDEACGCPLTVLCAPAGYGKTTALATWLDTVDGGHGWVSLDAMDNDPQRLCAHLVSSIEGALPGGTGKALKALDGGVDPLEVVVPLLADALAERIVGRLVVVLDDYHVIESADCHAFVGGLIDALPPSMCMIVSSRSLPPLRVPRRRTIGMVRELGSRELAFQGYESQQLLNEAFGLGLDRETVAAIEARVEGWPAALGLVASSLALHANPASELRALGQRHPDLGGTGITDYMVEEVLGGVSPQMRDFLWRTSILERLSGPLCAAVLQDDNARELLAEVRRLNLFVTVLDEPGVGEWLRYHHVFAELLQGELRARSPELIPTLHHRAAEWFAANGMPEEAIMHASLAGDGKLAAALLWDCWGELMEQWRFVTMRRMIAQLPADRGELAGFCEALDTVCWSLEGADLRLVAERLDALEAVRDAPGVAPIIDRSRVSPFYGDVARSVRDGWAAWERYTDPTFRTEISGQFGQVLWFAGDPGGAREIIEPRLYEIRRPAARTWAWGTLSLVAAGEGDLELAERFGRQAVAATGFPAGAGASAAHFGHTALAEALRLRGQFDEAEDQLARAAQLTSKYPSSFVHAFTLVFEAQLALTRRDRDRAREQASAARAALARYPDPGIVGERLAAVESALGHSMERPLEGREPTAAELRVLALLATDLTVRQIADRLYLSVKTVGAHRRRLYRKLGAASREHAVEIARQRGLIPPTSA